MPDSAQSIHPGASQLAAFAQNKLADAERAALQDHLKACPACQKALVALPGGAESLSAEDTQGTAGVGAPSPGATATHHPGGDVPADLANHPRYEVLQLLGQGGMGAVYKARHKKMDRFVALKVINTKLLDNPKAVERFQREVKAAAKLDHPNIVRAHDADEAGGTHFLVMEFVEGTDLAKYVEKKGPLPVTHACHFIRQAALGLQHAHAHGMVHRDIKPHNLMLANPVASAPGAPVIKVMDFGLARIAREGATEVGLTGENALMGTADYIAPEQAQDAHKADIRADIYSLGCTLYHLLAGKPPFAGGAMVQKIAGHLTGTIALAELPASVPAELQTVLAKMVAKDPAQRYQTPDEVAQVLLPFLKKGKSAKPVGKEQRPTDSGAVAKAFPDGVNVAEESAAQGVSKPKRRWPVVALIGAGVCGLLLAGSAVYLGSREGRSPVDPSPGPLSGDPLTRKQPEGLPPTYKNSLSMEFMLVPKGKSWLGGGGGKPGETELEIERDFYLGKYEVTQEEWIKVMGISQSWFSRDGGGKNEVKDVADADLKRFPVEMVSWDDAQLFLQKLNKQDKQDGWMYRLSKEVEWEYACRGGPMSDKLDSAFDFYIDKPVGQLRPERANFKGSTSWNNRPRKVGSYKPNKLGLYDMHGNVWEWCDSLSYPNDKDPFKASLRVSRGGSFISSFELGVAKFPMTHGQSYSGPDLGLRVARVPVGK